MKDMNSIRLEIPGLASARTWDLRLNTLDHLETTLSTLAPQLQDRLHARRYLQAILATRDQQRIATALAEVSAYGHTGLEGVVNKARVALGEYAAVLKGPRALPASVEAETLENLLDDEVAQASACVELGELHRAQAHLHAARLLAELLHMPYQLQWCLLEGGRLSLVQGRPQSDKVKEALSMIQPSARRGQWGGLTLAASLYSEGDGEAAWAVARTLDPAESQGFATLLALYLGYEISEHELMGEGIYAAIARAVHDPTDTAQLDQLPLPEHEPARSIVQGLKLAVLASNPQHAVQAVTMTENVLRENTSPISRVFLQAMLVDLGIKLHSERLREWLCALAEALENLRSRDYAFRALRTHAPHCLALLAFSPYCPPDLQALGEALPLIVGQHLLVDGGRHALPGRSQGGVQLVRQGYFGKQVRLHHAARRRIQQATARCGYPMTANLGELLRAMLLVVQQAPEAEKDACREAVIRLTELLESRTVLAEIQECPIFRQTMKV